jgi:hypothetical protein
MLHGGMDRRCQTSSLAAGFDVFVIIFIHSAALLWHYLLPVQASPPPLKLEWFSVVTLAALLISFIARMDVGMLLSST